MGAGGVILVSDKKARLKPCLRCGYSLLRIAGAKNCPECGLAVRVSLGGNSGLEWSNPRWQRVWAAAFGMVALGMGCRLLSFLLGWVIYWDDEGYINLGTAFEVVAKVGRFAGEADLFLSGLGLCVLAKGEGRHPDRSRVLRGITLGAGVLLIALGVLRVLGNAFYFRVRFVRYSILYAQSGPWVPLVISILLCAFAFYVGRRSGSRLLRRVAQVPLWPSGAAFVVWLLSLYRVYWAIPSILEEGAFPLATIVTLAVSIKVLLSGAREAEQNWVSHL